MISRQRRSITGRRGYNPAGISSSPPYYPKQDQTIEEAPPEREYEYGTSYKTRTSRPDLDRGYYRGMNRDDMMAAQEEGYYENIEREKRGEDPLTEMEIHQGYIDKFKMPDDTLTGLRRERSANLPAGDMDISVGLPEGVSVPGNMPGGASLQAGGQAFGKGQYGKGFTNTAKGILEMTSAPITAPMMAINKAIEPITSKIKGLFAQESTPIGPSPSLASFGHDAPGTVGMIGSGPGAGLPASMGLPAPGALGSGQSTGMPGIIGGPMAGQGIDLGGLNMGGIGDGMGGMGGLGDTGASVGEGEGDF